MAATLRLKFFDVHEDPVLDEVDVRLEHMLLNEVTETRKKQGAASLSIKDLSTSQGGRYLLRVNPKCYRSSFRMLRLEDSPARNEQVFDLFVRPDRAKPVFPEYGALRKDLQDLLGRSARVEDFNGLSGELLYNALLKNSLPCAGLLNLYCKMKATLLSNGSDVFSYMEELMRLRQDRIFARVKKELRDQVIISAADGRFTEVEGALHKPPPDFNLIDSYKTPDPPDRYGNLQLTFFANPQTLEFIVDADIDDAAGVDHLFQVADHLLTGNKTHPYDIHQILTYHQRLPVGYDLIV